ncbi:MAG: phage tail protein [Laribacter sp.]|nr:phage tail protein [Laribacter sp.]
MSKFYTLLTAVGAAALVNAQASGGIVPFTHIALGDGNGAAVVPTESMKALTHEVHRVPISSVTVDADNPNWLVVEAVVQTTTGGWTVREIGLIGDGKLLAVGNFPDTYKPQLDEGSGRDLVIRMIVQVSNASVVQLTVDPSVAVATNQSIANAIAAHEAKPHAHPQYLTQQRADGLYAPINLPKATESVSGLVELATAAEVIAGTDDERAVTPAGLTARRATETLTGIVELATAAEVIAGTDDERAVTPAGLTARRATETLTGIVELATAAEVIAGTDDERAVTPAGLTARRATETLTGIVELATADEVIAGTDDERAVTPAGLTARRATETLTGIVELATADEVIAGTDEERTVTPAGAHALVRALRARRFFHAQF